MDVSIKERNTDQYATGYSMEPRTRVTHAHVAGMLDAEGCVGITISETGSGFDYHMNPYAKTYQANDDRVMGLFAGYAQQQNVSYSIYETERENRDKTYRTFNVSGRENVHKFLFPLRNLIAVKKEQVNIMLNRILPRLSDGKHRTKEGFIETMEWIDKLNSYKGGNRGKYTQEYFCDEWGIEP